MTIKYLPILPPNIRPIMRLQDTTLVTTDLNILYAKIIESNKKITKLKKAKTTKKIMSILRRALQDNVDRLINNEKTNNLDTDTLRNCKINFIFK